MKTFFGALAGGAAILTILFLGFGQYHADANRIVETLKTTCAQFASAYDAQKYAVAHPQVEKRLDHDHDGLVCEALQ